MSVCVRARVYMCVPKGRPLPCAVLLLIKEFNVQDELGVGIQVQRWTQVQLPVLPACNRELLYACSRLRDPLPEGPGSLQHCRGRGAICPRDIQRAPRPCPNALMTSASQAFTKLERFGGLVQFSVILGSAFFF